MSYVHVSCPKFQSEGEYILIATHPQHLRVIHIQFQMIYVSRNPRDACISFYHFCKLMEGYNGTFQQFAEMYLEGNGTITCSNLVYFSFHNLV